MKPETPLQIVTNKQSIEILRFSFGGMTSLPPLEVFSSYFFSKDIIYYIQLCLFSLIIFRVLISRYIWHGMAAKVSVWRSCPRNLLLINQGRNFSFPTYKMEARLKSWLRLKMALSTNAYHGTNIDISMHITTQYVDVSMYITTQYVDVSMHIIWHK